MKEEYTQAFFHGWIELEQPLAVITAYNPKGELIDNAENSFHEAHWIPHIAARVLTDRVRGDWRAVLAGTAGNQGGRIRTRSER